ncbi:hypothetical protein JTB14_011381 [Gonioctena quinquepunctata]|nr:hypothetical protein JTB14_011381 [Gonioctena quinquepunctata]
MDSEVYSNLENIFNRKAHIFMKADLVDFLFDRLKINHQDAFTYVKRALLNHDDRLPAIQAFVNKWGSKWKIDKDTLLTPIEKAAIKDKDKKEEEKNGNCFSKY